MFQIRRLCINTLSAEKLKEHFSGSLFVKIFMKTSFLEYRTHYNETSPTMWNAKMMICHNLKIIQFIGEKYLTNVLKISFILWTSHKWRNAFKHNTVANYFENISWQKYLTCSWPLGTRESLGEECWKIFTWQMIVTFIFLFCF